MNSRDALSHVEDLLARALVTDIHNSSHGPNGSSMTWRGEDRSFRLAMPHTDGDEDAVIDASWTVDGIEGSIDLGPVEENAPRIARLLADLFPAAFGRLLRDADEDRFGNKVSIAILRSGKRMRIVHHPFKPKEGRRAPFRPRFHYSTVYAGRGVFVKMTEDLPGNDCMADGLKIAGYEASWGDGELLDVENAPDGPDLKAAFREHVSNQNFETAILLVLSAIENLPEMWQTREPVPAASNLRAA